MLGACLDIYFYKQSIRQIFVINLGGRKNMDFSELIKSDREKSDKFKFEGSFLEYLDIVKKNPIVAELAHKRMYDLIIKRGFEVLNPEENHRIRKIYGNDIIKRYNFFKDDFFGIDKVIMKLVNYFYSASMRGKNQGKFSI